MSYTYSTISSATPGQALMAAMDTAIDGHAAWEFVEEVTSGANTARIYRCLGAVNSFGTDFHIAIRRATADGSVMFALSEGWNSTTKRMVKPAVFATSTTAVTPAADGSFSTDRDPLTEMTNAVSMLYTTVHGVNTTGFEYWISVTNDAIVFLTRATGTVHGPTYVGLYDSFHSSALDTMPVVLWGPTAGGVITPTDGATTTTALGARTRALGWTAGTVFGGWASSVAATPWTWTYPLQAAASVSKEAASQKWWASRAVVRSTMGSAIVTVRRGVLEGLLKPHVIYMRMDEIAEVVGDTVTIDGVVHTCIYTSTNSLWLSQAA